MVNQSIYEGWGDFVVYSKQSCIFKCACLFFPESVYFGKNVCKHNCIKVYKKKD